MLCFGAASVILQRDLYAHMRKDAFALFAAGTIDVFSAGFLKALWKLLYALGICDFHALNTLLLPMQSLGFLLAGMGALSGKDATQALYNWIEQGINCAAQGCFLAGALVLHRSGLKDL